MTNSQHIVTRPDCANLACKHPRKKRVRFVGLVASCVLVGPLTSGIVGEERRAIESIARVLFAFEHVCTASQIDTLKTIVEDRTASDAERALAGALMRVLHVPDPRDNSFLLALERDSSVPPSVRTVAGVMLRLVHVPSDADRALLEAVIATTSLP